MSEPFVVNVSEAPAFAHPRAGITVSFEDPKDRFVHCPPGTDHVFVGGGEGPSWILMVGARGPDATIHYPRNDAAAAYGASAERSTDDPGQAYAAWSSEFTETTMPWPPTG